MNTIKLNSISLNGNLLNSMGEGKIGGENYNEVTCYHSIPSNGNYKLFGGDISQVEKMWVDGEEITPIKAYTLTRGEHKVVIRFSNLTTCVDFFYYCTTMTRVNLKNLDTSSVTNFNSIFARCIGLKFLGISHLDFSKGTVFAYFILASRLFDIDMSNIDFRNNSSTNGIFQECINLTNLNPPYNWRNRTISLADSPNLTPLSIHRLIDRAIVGGQRTLSLHATAKANWMASEYYDVDVVMANEKLITIA